MIIFVIMRRANILFGSIVLSMLCTLNAAALTLPPDTSKGSVIAENFEKMSIDKFFNSVNFTPVKINSKYAPGVIPEYTDSMLIDRIERMKSASPFEYRFNDDVKRWINFYISKRYFIARLIGLSSLYYPMFEEIMDRYGVPLEMKNLAIIESALNPVAKSRVGAAGLWQFMYKTGILYDLNVTSYVDDRFDPYKSTVAAARHMRDLFDIYKDWALVLAAYNAGPGTVNRAIRSAGGETNYWKIKHFMPRETQQYVPAFIAASYFITFYQEHNIVPMKPDFVDWEIDTVTIRQEVSLAYISTFYDIPLDELKFLNPQFFKGIIPSTEHNQYVLRIPRKHTMTFLSRENAMYDSLKSKKLRENAVDTNKNVGKTNYANQTQNNSQTNTYQAPTNGKLQYHTVKNGETMGGIAGMYGVSSADIKSWNNLRVNTIYVGQKLKIYSNKTVSTTNTNKNNVAVNTNKTGNAGKFHTVQKGETLWGISQKYGVTVDAIKKANNIGSGGLQVGQKLKIP